MNANTHPVAAMAINVVYNLWFFIIYALLYWRHDRRAGLALSAFALLIMVGSVHLGWHYALDGYVGAAGAVAIWLAVGALLPRQPRDCAATTPPRAGQIGGLRHEH